MKTIRRVPLWPLFIAPTITASAQSDTLRVLQLLEDGRRTTVEAPFGDTYALDKATEAHELAERIGWEHGMIKTHLALFLTYRDMGDRNPEAYTHLYGIGPLLHAATAADSAAYYTHVAYAYAWAGIKDSCFLFLDTAERAAAHVQDPRVRIRATWARGWIERGLEHWVPAMSAFMEVRAYADRVGDSTLIAFCANHTGMIRGRLGDLAGAERDFSTSLAIGTRLNSGGMLVYNNWNWGYVLQVKERWHEALQHYRDAVAATKRHPRYAELTGMIEISVGYMLVRVDSLDQAGTIIDRLKAIPTIRDGAYAQEFALSRALLSLRRGRARDAVRIATVAFNTPQVDEGDVVKRDASRIIADAYRALGRANEALEWTETAHEWQDSVLYREQSNQAQRMEMEREMAARAAQDSLVNAQERRRMEAVAASQLGDERNRKLLAIGGGMAVLVLAFVLWRRLGRTRREKAASEAILYNVLPEDVAQEIKRTGSAQSREIDQVSILFTDFKGFTELSATLPRQELMAEIDACFKVFDEISHRHDVEKIKTIGDAYMAAAGLKGVAHDAAVHTVQAALEMQAFIEARYAERTAQGLPAFRMRVGIHTGPVVAGIVGVKKFQYDIWGDTVNTASRMESSGEVGQVNISEATYALVKNEASFTFIPRGKVQAKGKGELEMYFVAAQQAT